MKAMAILILALSFFVTAGAQPNPDTLWTRTYGGSGRDEAYSVQQTTDGGYILVGSTWPLDSGATDCFLVKTDSQGDTLWTRTYGGSSFDYAYSVQQTADGGYILAGHTQSFGAGMFDAYAVKTDAQGDTLWTHLYGGAEPDYAHCVQQTADGGYIFAGYTTSFGAGYYDIYLVKTDGIGVILWTRAIGGDDSDMARSIQQTSDGGYIVAGCTNSLGEGGNDFYLVKTNSQGDTIWTRTYGGSNEDIAFSVQQTADGGYIMAGYTNSFSAGNYDYYLVKTNAQGDTLWTRTYGGSASDYAYSIKQTDDHGYIVAGHCRWGSGHQYEFYVVKLDSQGTTLWVRNFGGSLDDGAYAVQQTTDGGYIVAGYTNSFGAGGRDYYLVKTGPEPQGSEQIEVSIPEQYALYPNFPNPFNANTEIVYELPKAGRVSLKVFNLLGEEVTNLVDRVQAAGRQTVAFDGTGLASGVYLYRLQAEGFVQARKMVLLK
jgi:uncharacterized delta-60 repeat protein